MSYSYSDFSFIAWNVFSFILPGLINLSPGKKPTNLFKNASLPKSYLYVFPCCENSSLGSNFHWAWSKKLTPPSTLWFWTSTLFTNCWQIYPQTLLPCSLVPVFLSFPFFFEGNSVSSTGSLFFTVSLAFYFLWILKPLLLFLTNRKKSFPHSLFWFIYFYTFSKYYRWIEIYSKI